ncbi:unnamed protein product [Vitrella brassicaformis CCMP3155]|uniref:Uncharacterized protein n=1 Tax=Vitrella brassicaformis (strain CCMP3155) TaxID=1169540 RepID=A0A0G4G193_VITBC|nr:unnamed protein product [Vitrella brassicaformis CCMP3155]|eukprot:CEM21839.1 unnamed protein product [Vitrella brassicaformis CCMP3155]
MEAEDSPVTDATESCSSSRGQSFRSRLRQQGINHAPMRPKGGTPGVPPLHIYVSQPSFHPPGDLQRHPHISSPPFAHSSPVRPPIAAAAPSRASAPVALPLPPPATGCPAAAVPAHATATPSFAPQAPVGQFRVSHQQPSSPPGFPSPNAAGAVVPNKVLMSPWRMAQPSAAACAVPVRPERQLGLGEGPGKDDSVLKELMQRKEKVFGHLQQLAQDFRSTLDRNRRVTPSPSNHSLSLSLTDQNSCLSKISSLVLPSRRQMSPAPTPAPIPTQIHATTPSFESPVLRRKVTRDVALGPDEKDRLMFLLGERRSTETQTEVDEPARRDSSEESSQDERTSSMLWEVRLAEKEAEVAKQLVESSRYREALGQVQIVVRDLMKRLEQGLLAGNEADVKWDALNEIHRQLSSLGFDDPNALERLDVDLKAHIHSLLSQNERLIKAKIGAQLLQVSSSPDSRPLKKSRIVEMMEGKPSREMRALEPACEPSPVWREQEAPALNAHADVRTQPMQHTDVSPSAQALLKPKPSPEMPPAPSPPPCLSPMSPSSPCRLSPPLPPSRRHETPQPRNIERHKEENYGDLVRMATSALEDSIADEERKEKIWAADCILEELHALRRDMDDLRSMQRMEEARRRERPGHQTDTAAARGGMEDLWALMRQHNDEEQPEYWEDRRVSPADSVHSPVFGHPTLMSPVSRESSRDEGRAVETHEQPHNSHEDSSRTSSVSSPHHRQQEVSRPVFAAPFCPPPIKALHLYPRRGSSASRVGKIVAVNRPMPPPLFDVRCLLGCNGERGDHLQGSFLPAHGDAMGSSEACEWTFRMRG